MPLTRFTLRQLEAFIVVSDLRSFSDAGERLGLSAQAVSRHIAELEEAIGFRLFDRTTRRVTPTSAGQEFFSTAHGTLRNAKVAETAAEDLRNRAAGLVRVGAPLVLAATALPEAIKQYLAIRPKVSVRIRDLTVDSLVDAVAAGDVDIAIGPDRVTGSEVLSQPVFDSPWVLWCAPNYPLSSPVRWDDLRNRPLVAAGRDHERSVAQMCASAPQDKRVSPVDVVDNITTALGIASQGLAATLAPAYVGTLATKMGLAMRRVVDPEVVRKVCVYRSSSRPLSPATEEFVSYLSEWLPQWSEGIKSDKAFSPKRFHRGR